MVGQLRLQCSSVGAGGPGARIIARGKGRTISESLEKVSSIASNIDNMMKSRVFLRI